MAQSPVAIVGVSALFPGSTDSHGFWRDILAGKDLITDVPPTHWLIDDYYDPDPSAPDKTYAKRGGFLSDVAFDPLEFGVPPNIVPATDTAQLLALIVAQRVLEDAAHGAGIDRERASVILGVTSGQELLGQMVGRLQRPVWIKALRESGIPEPEAIAICERMSREYVPWQESTFPGLLGNVVAGRIANRFDLRGTNCVTDAACASTLSALSMALGELATGQSDLVITGGVDTMNDIFMYMCFSKTPALSPTGDCRPFSDAADGTLLGEGMAMLALKRLADAEAAGDPIYAVIRGLGSSSDGRSKSVYAPLPEGQARALDRAYQAAGYGPETVELVEAHGTATKAGDIAEFEGLRLAFERQHSAQPVGRAARSVEAGARGARADRQWCALGSVKSQIGHTKSAAGAAGLFKAVMALHHKVLPPTIKVERPNPAMRIDDSPFYLNTVARPWVRDASAPRRASVSSFGFGGSNFHVALEEYGGPAPAAARLRTCPTALVMLSGADSDALLAAIDRLDAAGDEVAAIARASHDAFDAAHGARLAVVATDAADLAGKLAAARARIAASPTAAFALPGVHFGAGAPEPGAVALLFPGQGSQYLGMGSDVAIAFDAARGVWDAAAAVAFDGERVDRMVFPRPAFDDDARHAQAARLTATEWAQPAIGLTSLALLHVLRAAGVRAHCVAGHSFGEVTALAAAGALSDAGLLAVARTRGELMRDAAAIPGAMTAVAGAIDDVRAVIADHPGVVVANHNHPAQVVLSGGVAEIDAVERALAGRGLTAKRLAVATAFHSAIVAPSAAPFADALRTIAVVAPELEVWSNATAAPYPREPDAVRAQLAGQIASPVRFVDQIEAMYARGVRTFIEVGPAAVLSDFVDRTLGARPHLAVPLDRKGKHGVTSFEDALGRLACGGLAIDFGVLWAGYAAPAAPRKKPAMTIAINGSNAGKPYPPKGGTAALPPPVAARPTPVAAAIAPAPVAVPASDAWATAYQQAQQQTAEAHTAYLKLMADTHTAFLRTIENSFSSVSSPSPSPTVHPILAPIPIPIPIPTPTPAPAPMPMAASASFDLPALMLRIVAETTGYPQDMLALTMELEADLGIDSIKRVEILAAMREAAPALPEVDPKELGALRTLGQIVDYMSAGTANQSAPAASAASDLESLMLAIVAETTGYPADMLGLHMELEADLGIDSIKRVEILATLRERAPTLPEVDAKELGALRTLGQIVDYMRRGGAPEPPTPPSPPKAPTPPRSTITALPQPSLARSVLTAEPARACGLATPGLLTATHAIVTDDGELAPMVVALLRERGVAAQLGEPDAETDVLIELDGLRDVGLLTDALAINAAAFRRARTVAPRFAAHGGVLITVQDTGGDFGLGPSHRSDTTGHPAVAGLAALARTAALEWPAATARAIDIERGERSAAEIAAALVDELVQGGVVREVGLAASGARVELRSHARAATAGASVVSPRDVVVVSGGARGVTAACVIELARAAQPHLVLLGRTALAAEPASCHGVTGDAALKRALLADATARGITPTPIELGAQVARVLADREIRATLAACEACGSTVRYEAVDVTDHVHVADVLAEVRAAWGPITAVVHAAGVLADKRIADKTDDQFARVFDTKVLGAAALLAATAGDPLRWLVLFSSVAARAGNPGQCDYAMANEVLNKLALAERRARGAGFVAKAIGWGPWHGGMVTPSLAAVFAQRGHALIPLADGARAFVAELAASPDEIEVVIGAGAAGLTVEAPPAAQAFELAVSERSHPYLNDHRLGGVPVVPVAVAIEWMARAATALQPGLAVIALRNLRVLRGIKLEHFHAGEHFVVECKPGDGGAHAIELRGRDGARHYSATVARDTALGATPDLEPAELEPWTGEAIYDGHLLFHGPAFQVLHAIDGVSAHGSIATMAATPAVGWPAALDGALQLAVVWSRHVLGGATLPMAIADVRLAVAGLAEGPLRCIVRARTVAEARATCDVELVAVDGAVVASLVGVETVLRPGEAPAARVASSGP